MIKKLIKAKIEDKYRSTISKKEIRKFKQEADEMKKKFRDVSKFKLGV